MRQVLLIISGMLLVFTAAYGQEETTVRMAEPFRTMYTGDDATGEHVIALWQFDAGAETTDASGNGHDLTLRGATISDRGRFGGALESYRGWPDIDEIHGAEAANNPALTPAGAFSIEMWISPKEDIEGYPESFMLDKKYIDHTDYQIVLSPAGSTGLRTLYANLGFGGDSVRWSSEPHLYEPGEWYHIAFVYDGEGTGSWFINGQSMGSRTEPGRKGIVAGRRNLVIGDRVGSLYHGFPGFIDQVRITGQALEFRPAGFVMQPGRTVFKRMEKPSTISFAVQNFQREPLQGARAFFALGTASARSVELPEIAPGASYDLQYDFDTALRPGTYKIAATIDVGGEYTFTSTERFDLTITPRDFSNGMPVLMWGGYIDDVQRLAEIGFTHVIGLSTDYKAIMEAGEPIPAANPQNIENSMRQLDEALRHGVNVTYRQDPGRWARGLEEYRRIGPDGQQYGGNRHDVCALFPEIQKMVYNSALATAQTWGGHPAVDSILVHTEVRGESEMCFHDHDREAFRQFAGYDIPEGLQRMRGTPYQNLKDFPQDRVIPDDYPPFVYYKWLWKDGDGWNKLHSLIQEGTQAGPRKDIWTFFDPAVRVASVYGSGGDVDVLSQWTYSYPDPIRIGLATDELFCMAAGANRPDQQVMKMTQIIWYRSQTAPEPGEEAQVVTGAFQDQDVRPQGTGTVDATGRYQAAWEREIPDARFISISPTHLREAFWAKIARPIQGIMYHGYGSLVDLGTAHGYRFTNPDTRYELTRLVNDVVRPLGPALKQIPDRPTDVAFLESFASQMFARRGTYGWNGGWEGEMFLIASYAQLQPQVVYEETVQQKGLDQFNVLLMPACDVLPASVVEEVKKFQARGGIVVGDEYLAPAITPDILIETHSRPRDAQEARALLMERTAELRSQLDPHYRRFAGASTPDVVTRARKYNSTDYLFAINDLREFGDYVGHHKLVMENGLPTDATLFVNRNGGYVYDLVAHRAVEATVGDGHIAIPAHFGPGEGKLLMLTDKPIGGVVIEVPQTMQAGGQLPISVTVTDGDGEAMDAVIPVKIELIDPQLRPAEITGYYAAIDGRCTVTADIATNDAPGLWRVRVTELASGQSRSHYVRLAGMQQ